MRAVSYRMLTAEGVLQDFDSLEHRRLAAGQGEG